MRGKFAIPLQHRQEGELEAGMALQEQPGEGLIRIVADQGRAQAFHLEPAESGIMNRIGQPFGRLKRARVDQGRRTERDDKMRGRRAVSFAA